MDKVSVRFDKKNRILTTFLKFGMLKIIKIILDAMKKNTVI